MIKPPIPDSSPPYTATRTNARLALSGIGLLVLILLLVGSTRWFLERGFVIGPTPTLTPTPRTATDMPTVDFRATQNAADLATQQAYELALLGMDTPTPQPTASFTPEPTVTPTLMGIPTATPSGTITITISIPIVESLGQSTNTPSPLPTPTLPDNNAVVIDTPTSLGNSPLPTPAQSPDVGALPTATPTEVPPTLISTSTTVPVVTLQAITARNSVLRMGPSSLFTQTVVVGSGRPLFVHGRTVSGEWVYICCAPDNVEGWTHQANVRIEGNPTPMGAPPETNGNDPRRLVERQPTVALPNPPPASTPVSAGDFPLYRRDPAGQANLGRIFGAAYRPDWPAAIAGGAMSSGVVAAGNSVLVGSEDSHLYSFSQDAGSQRWRTQLSQVMRHAPAVVGGDIYVIDNTGTIAAFRDQGNSAQILWTTGLGIVPANPLNAWGDFLLVTGTNNRLYVLNRQTRATVWEAEVPGNAIAYPVVGDQLVYVGNRLLRALDLYDGGKVVWEDTRFTAVSAPPIYSQPGTLALAEVYAADANGNIYALNANTGALLWTHGSNERSDALALDQSNLYANGNGFIKAIDRRNGTQLWRYAFGDRIMGGILVGEGRLLFVSESGTIQVLNALNGNMIFATSIPFRVAGSPAASGNHIFIPGIDGRLYALIEANE